MLASPFEPLIEEQIGRGPGGMLTVNAAALALMNAIDCEARSEASRPIHVRTSPDIPISYTIAALIPTLRLVREEPVKVLPAYVTMDMMRLGIVRSSLTPLAGLLSCGGFDITLAAYLDAMIRCPDRELPEYDAIGDERYAAIREEFEHDPLAFVTQRFGSDEIEREPGIPVPDARLRDQVAEPQEDESSSEDEAGATVPAEHIDVAGDPLVEYVAAHMKAHESPVLARAVRAYVEKGTAQVETELKVTKAPKKTLAAIVKVLTARYRKVALIYDRFQQWHNTPPDLRAKIAGQLSELRWRLRDGGMLILVSDPGLAPELDEAFGGAVPVDWSFKALPELEREPDLLSAEIVQGWVDAATLSGAEPMSVSEGPLGDLFSAADGSLSAFVRMAGSAFRSAAARGADSLDADALGAGLRDRDVER